MTTEEINQKLIEHIKWLKNAGGQRIDLEGADLRRADLTGADLRRASLRCAILRNAELEGADLRCANLRNADLEGAILRNAILQGADLQYASLRCADLEGADLQGADLQGADLQCASLPSRYIQVGCIGSRGGATTYSFAEDKIWCGCFVGGLAEFRERVIKTYPQSGGHQAEYLGLIAYIEALQKKEPPEIV